MKKKETRRGFNLLLRISEARRGFCLIVWGKNGMTCMTIDPMVMSG